MGEVLIASKVSLSIFQLSSAFLSDGTSTFIYKKAGFFVWRAEKDHNEEAFICFDQLGGLVEVYLKGSFCLRRFLMDMAGINPHGEPAGVCNMARHICRSPNTMRCTVFSPFLWRLFLVLRSLIGVVGFWIFTQTFFQSGANVFTSSKFASDQLEAASVRAVEFFIKKP